MVISAVIILREKTKQSPSLPNANVEDYNVPVDCDFSITGETEILDLSKRYLVVADARLASTCDILAPVCGWKYYLLPN